MTDLLTVDQAIEELGPLVKRKTLVPFFGAGISTGSKVPTARQFLEHLGCGQLDWPNGIHTLEKTEPGFWREFATAFACDREPNDQHRYLALLDAPHFITTNYDQLFEKACHAILGMERDKCFKVIRREQDLADIDRYRSVLTKLHGDVEVHDLLVCTRRDYAKRRKSPTRVDSFVEYLFATNTILFIGYSLGDDNILDILENEQERWPTPNLPHKYVVLPISDAQQEQRFRAFGVKPIGLGCIEPDQINEQVTEFLRRLWEHSGGYTDWVRFQEVRKDSTARKLLERALNNRQECDLENSLELLEKARGRGVLTGHVDLINTTLYLTVSIYDKLEEWDTLLRTERTLLLDVKGRLETSVPAFAYQTIHGTYQAAMALAMLRAWEPAESTRRITEVLEWQPSKTADPDMQVVFANALTVKAIIGISMWAILHSDEESWLADAAEHLEHAGRLYSAYAHEDTSEESHHLGRFYGARAFHRLAWSEIKQIPLLNDELLLEDAKRAHCPDNRSRRTRFGKVAGRYCDAYCRYRVAAIRPSSDERRQLLRESLSLLDSSIEDTRAEQAMVRAKLFALKMKVSERLAELDTAVDTSMPAKNFQEARRHLNRKSHQDLSEKEMLNQWLKTPLN